MHIRKPEATTLQTEALIKDIDKKYYQQLTIHYDFYLADKYALGGIHLSGKTPDKPQEWQGRVSASCHTLQEVQQHSQHYNYVFLSPIYDSISKNNYHAAFTAQQLSEAHERGIINNKVYALGGVTPDKLRELKELGFGGFAVLGGIWQSANTDTILRNTALYTNVAQQLATEK